MSRPHEEVPAYGATQLPATFQLAAISCEREECTAQIDGDHSNEGPRHRRRHGMNRFLVNAARSTTGRQPRKKHD
jgi:hypothetical protein